MVDLRNLQQQIQKGSLLPFYVFIGDEIELQNIYLHQMGNVERIDSVATIYKKITSRMLCNVEAKIYVVRDDLDFVKNEKIYSTIKDKIKVGTLVLQLTNISKCKKFINHMDDCVVEFNHMTTGQLINALAGQISGSQGVLKYFIESCNNDYNTIQNYIDIFHRLGYLSVTKQLVDEFIKRPSTSTVFDLADALMRLDSQQCYKLLDELLQDSNNAIGIIYAIYAQLHKCVLVEGYRGQDNIAQKTGINGWVCNNILRDNKIKPARLLTALRIIQKYDKGIKTGRYEPVYACYCLVTEILCLS
mgnify:FL=1